MAAEPSPPGAWVAFQSPHPEENTLSLRQQPAIINSSPSGVSPCPIHAGILTDSILCRCCAYNHGHWESMCVRTHFRQTLFPRRCLWPLSLTIFLQWSLSLGGRDCDIDVPSGDMRCTVCYSLHRTSLWVFVSVTMDCKKKLLWWGWSSALIYISW